MGVGIIQTTHGTKTTEIRQTCSKGNSSAVYYTLRIKKNIK